MYQARIMKFSLLKASYVLNPFVLKRLHVHIHIFARIVGSWNYQRQENVLSLHNLSGGEIEWKDKYEPTTLLGCRHTKHTEPIRADADSRMPRICRFVTM